MAKYGDIVAGLTVGTYGSSGPTGFTNRWDGPGSSQNLDVIEDLSSASGKAIRFWMTASSRTFFSWDGINADPDRDTSTSIALIRIKNSPAGSSASFGGLVTRGSGTGTSETGITNLFGRSGTGAVLKLIRYSNASATVVETTPEGGWVQNGIYWLKLSVSGTTAIASLYDENDLNGTPIREQSVTAPASNSNNWHGLYGFAGDTDYDVLYYAIGTGADQPDPPTSATEPVLTLPSGAATSDTTASGSVTTDTASGTLYAVVTTNATPPSKADIIAGTGAVYATSQVVTAAGVQNVSATGLTASTVYYWHFLHNDSNIATSASFTTESTPVTPPDTAPTGLTAVAQSDTVIRLTWNSLAGATGYKIRRDGATATDVGNVLTADVTGLTAVTQYGFDVLAYNAAGDGPYSTQVLGTTQAASAEITLITAIDGGNVSSSLSSIVNPESSTPRLNLFARPATTTGTNGSGWRRMGFAIEGASGKSPVFAIDRADMADRDTSPTSAWLPMYTTDGPEVLNPTYVQATSKALVGGSTGTIEFSFDAPLPSGRVYVMTHPMGAQAQAATLATELLNNYPGVVTPTSSADASGVYFVTPPEVDENGRQIGGHNTYSFKAQFGGSTTDGGPKRKLLMIAGVHSSGEQTSFVCFRSCLKYILESSDAAAANLRANWDIYCYFNVTANGIFGGHRRHGFESNLDPNRDYLNKATPQIAALTSAIVADTGGTADVSFDWHGYASAAGNFISWAQDTPQARKFIELGEAIFGTPARNGGLWSTATDTSTGWTLNTLGVKYAVAAEVPQRGDTSDANYKFIGEAWAKTLEATDQDPSGQFYSAPAGVANSSFSSVSASSSGFVYLPGLSSAIPSISTAQSSVTYSSGLFSSFISYNESSSLLSQFIPEPVTPDLDLPISDYGHNKQWKQSIFFRQFKR